MALQRIKRDAFLYMDPRDDSPEEEFAQCAVCRLFVPQEYLGKMRGARCVAFGSGPEVVAEGSCGLFLIWPSGLPDEEVLQDYGESMQVGMLASATLEEAGYVVRLVRCENCAFFDAKGRCNLFVLLNAKFPSTFDLDSRVDERGCCNANTAVSR